MVTPLMLASISGDAAMVLMLLKAGADRYAVDSQGNTAASIAMQAGHMAVVRLLLADPEHISLSEACASGNMNLVEGLLGQGVEINERHEDGQCTALIAAAYMGHMAVLDKLLSDRRTDVNFTNTDGETALMFSAQPSSTATPEQKVAVALRLLEHGANRYLKDALGRTALSWAERWGYQRLIHILEYDPAQLQIYECAKDGNVGAVQALIDQKVDVNTACPTRQFTPLIAAVFNSDLAMIDLLLKCPTLDINVKGRQGMTALHYASQIGNVEVVGRLLAARADRAIQDDRGMLPRDVAERKGFTDVYNMLRFDPKQVSICLAAMHGDWLVIQSLLLQGVSVNTRQKHHSDKGWHHERYTPLIAAVAYNKVEVVKKLLAQPNIDVNLPNLLGQTPLMYAAAKGNERLVLVLLRAGANRYLVDRDQRSALAWAMKHNHLNVAHILSADPARMTVQETIREGNKDLTVALFKQRVDVNHRLAIAEGDPRGALVVDGETPLISAARYGRNDLMALIFKSPDVLVDLADASGKTPLIHAAMVGNEDGAIMLLQHGANRQHMDFDRKTATDYALARRHEFIATILKTDPERVCIHAVCVDGEVAVLHALLRQDVSVNARDLRKGTKQETPLIVAAKHNRLDIVDFLLTQPGLEIDAADADGRTALMVAAAVGALDVTASLLKAGANRHLKDRAGLNADNWAGKFGHLNLMRFIAQQIYY
jgi:serine/threonine-protein phosphatase 6 regulatory ankyrin repeat subunit B